MPAISTEDAALLRQFPQGVRRYLSAAPRAVVLAARVSSETIGRDAVSGGMFSIPYESVTAGAYADVIEGMTLDIGTTAGGAEIGRVRVRAADGGQIVIGEAALDVSAGDYLTVRREFRPWGVRPRRVEATTDAAYPTDFSEYHDYDVAYTDQNSAIPPKANVTAGEYAPVKLAGFVDAGEDARTVTLSAATSLALATGATITVWDWDVGDGALVDGGLDEQTITVAFPVGFRYAALTVTDSNGVSSLMRLPIWVHDAEHPPITAFTVARDETRSGGGREMRFEVFENADAGVIPEGSAICYWEAADFGDDPAPASYRGQFLGWAVRDAVRFRLYRSRYVLDVEGAAGWLDRMGGVAQTLIDVGEIPAAWQQMQGLTLDRAAHYALRSFSNVLALANFTPSGVDDAAQTISLPARSVWAQVGELVKGYYGTAGCDSLGGIWLRRHASALSAAEQALLDPVIGVSSADWTDAHGLTLPSEKSEAFGVVEGSGAIFDGATLTPVASVARGGGVGRAVAPFQIVVSQDALNDATGRYLARLNNPRPAVTLRLLGNLDAVEPAWGEPISIGGAGENVRGLVLDGAHFLVTSVRVEHSDERGKPPKIITWTLEGITSGGAGITLDVPEQAVKPVKPTKPSGGKKVKPVLLTPGTGTIAALNDDGYVYVTRNFSAVKPTWTRYALGDLGMSGTLQDFVPDPFSPLYLGTGSAVDGWLVSTEEIGRLTDIFGTPGYTAQHSFASAVVAGAGQRLVETERSTPGFVVVASYYHDTGTTAIVTTDGETWGSETMLWEEARGSYLSPGLAVSGKHAGVAYAVAGAEDGLHYQAQKYSGGSWLPITDPFIFGLRLPGWFHFPWHDNDDSLAYYGESLSFEPWGQVYKAVGEAWTTITPYYEGRAYTCRYPRSIDTPALNHHRVVLCGHHDPPSGSERNAVFVSKNGGDSWKLIYGPVGGGASDYLSVRCAGDDEDVIYLFGGGGHIAYSTDFGATPIKSKRGSMDSFSGMGRFVNVCGG